MADFISIYVTAGSSAEAHEIARRLVEEKSAACVNIFPNIETVYRWKDKVESSSEVVMIVKTRAALFGAVESTVKKINRYENPCIVVLPIIAGSDTYTQWLLDATKSG